MKENDIVKGLKRVSNVYPDIKMDLKTIKYIANKLDENERSALARLMKVKDMLANE